MTIRKKNYYYRSSKPEEICVRPAERKCLRCRRKFKSAGIHQRLCRSCRHALKKAEMDRGLEISPCHATLHDSFSVSDLPIL